MQAVYIMHVCISYAIDISICIKGMHCDHTCIYLQPGVMILVQMASAKSLYLRRCRMQIRLRHFCIGMLRSPKLRQSWMTSNKRTALCVLTRSPCGSNLVISMSYFVSQSYMGCMASSTPDGTSEMVFSESIDSMHC